MLNITTTATTTKVDLNPLIDHSRFRSGVFDTQAGRKLMEGLATAEVGNSHESRTLWALNVLDDTPFQEEVVKWIKDYGHQRV